MDIHCVTRWSKFDTDWRGISVDRIFAAAGLEEPPAPFVMAFCDGGYTSNLPVEDLLEGKALVVWEYDGAPLAPAHGGPARLLVPHLYFWKSAKWVRECGGDHFMRNPPGQLHCIRADVPGCAMDGDSLRRLYRSVLNAH